MVEFTDQCSEFRSPREAKLKEQRFSKTQQTTTVALTRLLSSWNIKFHRGVASHIVTPSLRGKAPSSELQQVLTIFLLVKVKSSTRLPGIKVIEGCGPYVHLTIDALELEIPHPRKLLPFCDFKRSDEQSLG